MKVFTGLVVLLVIISGIGLLTFGSFNDHEFSVIVTEKERINDSSESKYLIFTEDANGKVRVFENVDNLLRFKFNSSDVYGQIKIGEVYKFTVVGWRIPFLSMYENIIKVN